MIVEVIAVGTEILLGQFVNSNTGFIGELLAEKGLDAHFQVTVGDNLARIASAVEEALGRSDAVVITGGIGPTQDDITREAVCLATGTEMVFDPKYAEHLREWWERRGRPMPESNLRQAYHPEGAELLANPRGTAPGLALAVGDKSIFCVPGVPAEMEHLMTAEVMPRLARLVWVLLNRNQPKDTTATTATIWNSQERTCGSVSSDPRTGADGLLTFCIY